MCCGCGVLKNIYVTYMVIMAKSMSVFLNLFGFSFGLP